MWSRSTRTEPEQPDHLAVFEAKLAGCMIIRWSGLCLWVIVSILPYGTEWFYLVCSRFHPEVLWENDIPILLRWGEIWHLAAFRLQFASLRSSQRWFCRVAELISWSSFSSCKDSQFDALKTAVRTLFLHLRNRCLHLKSPPGLEQLFEVPGTSESSAFCVTADMLLTDNQVTHLSS